MTKIGVVGIWHAAQSLDLQGQSFHCPFACMPTQFSVVPPLGWLGFQGANDWFFKGSDEGIDTISPSLGSSHQPVHTRSFKKWNWWMIYHCFHSNTVTIFQSVTCLQIIMN